MYAGTAAAPGKSIDALAIGRQTEPCIVIGALVTGGKNVPGTSIGSSYTCILDK